MLKGGPVGRQNFILDYVNQGKPSMSTQMGSQTQKNKSRQNKDLNYSLLVMLGNNAEGNLFDLNL